jgi:hypothetical protein
MFLSFRVSRFQSLMVSDFLVNSKCDFKIRFSFLNTAHSTLHSALLNRNTIKNYDQIKDYEWLKVTHVKRLANFRQ